MWLVLLWEGPVTTFQSWNYGQAVLSTWCFMRISEAPHSHTHITNALTTEPLPRVLLTVSE